jgi:AraC-like DNA-binding protein
MRLLERQPVFHSQDADETRVFLNRLNFDFELQPTEAAALDVRLNAIYLPQIIIGYVQYGSPVTIRVNPGRDDYWIQVPIRGRIAVTVGAEQILCGPERAAIVSPMRENLLRPEHLSARLNLAPRKAAVMQRLAALLGEPVDEAPEFSPDLDLTAGHGRDLARYLMLAVSDVERAGKLAWTPITVAAFEDFVISRLLLAHPHSRSDDLARTNQRIMPRDMRRALEYMDANLAAPISITDVVAATGIAGRTLFKHFRHFHGVSPMRFLRNARFDQVRRALIEAEPEDSITAIATRWGFSHMGRFAVDYRARYGETPSQTLARRRGKPRTTH